MGKTQKKLPDLPTGHYESQKGRNVGASSDSDDNNLKQLPLIKGGSNMQHTNSMHHNSQVSEAYSMKGSMGGHHTVVNHNGAGSKKNPQNTSFNQSKYMSNHSPSPSQTFFKGKPLNPSSLNNSSAFELESNSVTVPTGPHIVPYVDTKKGQSLVGKKILPPFNSNAQNSNAANKKAAKIYVSVKHAHPCRKCEFPREA